MTWLDDVTLESVVVHVDSGPSLRGLKSAVHDDCLVLRDVLVLNEDNSPEQLNGLYLVPRERVIGIQILTA
jgi:hypothetical protein